MSPPLRGITADPLQRFSSRVINYARYRPGYPDAAIDLLVEHCGLGPGCRVADLGSGTGILTARLIATGATVHAVEPNAPMRQAAEQSLRGRAEFHSVDGAAERTTLAERSVDLLTAGQAFHWFDGPEARCEARRIAARGARVALLWNERPTEDNPFLVEYDALLRRFAPEYQSITERRANVAAMHAFAGAELVCAEFYNEQRFDLAGLTGRLLSSSYAPEAGHPAHRPMLEALNAIHARHQHGGQVTFPYRTLVYYGPFRP